MSDEQDRRYSELDLRMREEWDRRIEHDYRYWMSDGVENDALMWEVGERDFRLLFQHVDLSDARSKMAIELGCGVGRLLRAAAGVYGEVLGVDVSPKALANAKGLLADLTNVKLRQGCGHDLSFLEDSSVDVAYSFAALGSMPVRVFANYLVELARVIKLGGQMVLQMYLGKAQEIPEEDTLALRSYERERFLAAMNVAGFSLLQLEELILPFEVSDVDSGVVAYMATLRRDSSPRANGEVIAQVLGVELEPQAGQSWKGSLTEYFMAIARAKQLLEKRRFDDASRALEFALRCYQEPEVSFFEVLEELGSSDAAAAERVAGKLNGRKTNAQGSPGSESRESRPGAVPSEYSGASGDIFAANLRVLSERFPQLTRSLGSDVSAGGDVSVTYAEDGSPVLVCEGVVLDQKVRPVRAAEMWVERTLEEPRIRSASALVVSGAATGYHLRELVKHTNLPLVLFEPRLDILRTWLSVIDAREVLTRLLAICTGMPEILQLDGLGDSPELVVHPQSRAISGTLVGELSHSLMSTRGLKTLSPAIAVVGPIYGGTLPMTDYVGRALASLGQRVHVYNLGEFYKSYAAVPNFVSDQARCNLLENQYVEFLSELVLEGIKEKPVDLLISLAQAPLSPRVLTELRSRGVVTAMWFVEDCGRFPTWKTLAPYYDYMFIIQRDKYLKLVEEAGAGRCYYLPTACDPTVHRPVALSEDEENRWGSKISFVGAGYHNRRKMLARLTQSDFRIWGTEWPDTRPFDALVQENGRRISPEEYVKIFNATAININLHSSSERDGVDPHGDFINPRTFELAAAGAFQLVDRRTLLPELFAEDREVACFSNEKELQDKIDYYSTRPEECKEMAARSRERALYEHTYAHRMRTMLGYIYADRYSEFKARAKNSPWAKTLKAAEAFPSIKGRLERAYQLGREPTLDSIVCDIQVGKGELTDEEGKLLFLHHVRKFIVTANELNEGKAK